LIKGRFTRNNWAPSSVFIRWATDSPWSHIEAAIRNYPGQMDGWLGAKPDGGVQIRPWDYDYHCEAQEFIIDVSGEVEQKFYKSFVDKIGCPYDWSAIFGFAASRDWHKDGQWFCSEAFEDSLEDAGDGLFREGQYWRITPGMFYFDSRVKMI